MGNRLHFNTTMFRLSRATASFVRPLPQWTSSVMGRWYADLPEHYVINMPALSPTMEEGNLASWEVSEGDEVEAGDGLELIQTDKAQLEFESPEDGFIARLFRESGEENIKVGELIAVIAEEEDDMAAFKDLTAADLGGSSASSDSASSSSDSESSESAAAPAAAAPSSSGSWVAASPLAKNTAAEQGVSLENVKGTGFGGRIVQADVLDAASAGAPAVSAASAPAPAAGSAYSVIPADAVRKVIASRLQESKQTIPHFYLSVDIELDQLMEVRSELNAAGGDEYKLTVNDFVVKASALALQQVPEVNSSWHGDFIRQYHTSDISVAVDTGSGLITPIVEAAESRGLTSISAKVKDLAARAKENKLAPHEYQGGTFSISNLGPYGISHFTAIINPPQACILAVGSGSKRIVPDADSEPGFREANVMTVTLSCDHRVVDGAVGARWLQVFKKYMENPVNM